MKKALLLAVALLAAPAFAQRGGTTHPLSNYAETCTVYGSVATGTSCSGYPKSWCVNYSTNIIYACDPTTSLWEAVGSAAGGGGGGTTITLISGGSTTFSSVGTIDFQSEFALSDVGGGEIEVSINDSTLAPNMTNATNVLAVANGGTAGASAAAARSNLGAAASGANSDITSLNSLSTPLSPSQGGTGLSDSSGMTNKVAVGQSSTALGYVTIPDCDATGNQLGFVQSTHQFECAADGAGGSGIEIDEEGVDITAAARSRLNFVGAAITAADNPGGGKVDITLSQSPSASTSVVGTGRTITPGTGLSGSAALDLSSDRTLAVDSTEAAFLTDSGATPVSGTAGKAGVMDAGPICYTDGAGTARCTAIGDATGNATLGDSATGFFTSGTLAVNIGGTGSTSIGSDTWCLYNSGGGVGADGGCTYVASTDTLTVGVIVATGAADNARYLELQRNSSDVSAPLTGFARAYASGASGAERPKWRTFTSGIEEIATLTGTGTITSKVIAGASNDLSLRTHATDCTANTDGVHGEPCYEVDADTIYVCEATGGAGNICDTPGEWKATGGAGAGDISAVWQTLAGAANAIVGSTGDSLDASAADFVRVPIDKTIDTAGKIGVDTTTTLDQLQVYMGGAVRAFSPMRSAGAVLESLVSTDDNYEFFEAPENVTIIGVSCRCRGTCTPTLATFTLEDRGGNAMTITGTNPTCSTTGNSTYAAVTAANTIVAGEGVAFDVTNTPTTGDTYTITIQYTVDPQ